MLLEAELNSALAPNRVKVVLGALAPSASAQIQQGARPCASSAPACLFVHARDFQ